MTERGHAEPDARTCPSHLHDVAAILLLLLLPAALFAECLFGDRKYLPFDIAEYPPIATTLTAEQVAALQQDANYDATEPPVWFVPELQLARAALQRSKYPHWNAYARGGAPLTAHGHLGLLDPLHWPALLFADPADGLLCLTMTMFAVAGVSMYGFLRALRLQPLAATFGAVAFALSGTMTANGHWFQRMEPLALLPGILWAELALSRARGASRALPAALLAAGIALCWLAGFPPFCIPTSLLAAAFGGVLVLAALRRGARGAGALFLWLAAAAVLGILLAAPQLLQQYLFFPVSNRTPDPTLASASRFAFAPCGFLGYVFPDLFSHPTDPSITGENAPLAWLLSDLREWGTGAQLLPNYNFTEYALFPGTLPLLFAVLAFLLRGPRWRFLALAALAGFWFLATGALGASSAFTLPVIKTVPPYRFVGPACAFVAVLAACGFQSLRAGAPPWLLRGLAVLLAAGAMACFALGEREIPRQTTADDPWVTGITERYREPAAKKFGVAAETITPQRALEQLFQPKDGTGAVRDVVHRARERLRFDLRRGGAALLLGAAFVFLVSLRGRERTLGAAPAVLALLFTGLELGEFGFYLNRGRALPYPHDSAVHRFLREERERAAQEQTGGFMIARGEGPNGPYQLPGGTLAADHVRDLHFYTFVDGHSSEPIRKLYGDAAMIRDYVPPALPDDARLELPWWDLVGLRFVLTAAPMQHAGRRVGPELKGPGGEFFVYERARALPRAHVVPRLDQVDGEEAAVAAVLRADLDPRAVAIVTRAEATRLGPELAADPAAAARRVTFVFEDEKRLALHVGDGPAGYLVLADTELPGWTATIGGAAVPIARGNVYQRVLPLPAGACDVHFRYATPGLKPGLVLGACGALACLALFAIGLLARRRRQADDAPSAEP